MAVRNHYLRLFIEHITFQFCCPPFPKLDIEEVYSLFQFAYVEEELPIADPSCLSLVIVLVYPAGVGHCVRRLTDCLWCPEEHITLQLCRPPLPKLDIEEVHSLSQFAYVEEELPIAERSCLSLVIVLVYPAGVGHGHSIIFHGWWCTEKEEGTRLSPSAQRVLEMNIQRVEALGKVTHIQLSLNMPRIRAISIMHRILIVKPILIYMSRLSMQRKPHKASHYHYNKTFHSVML